MHITIGSRGSELALWQANYTKAALEQLGATVEIKIISTKGDQIQHLSFDKIEGKGFFTKELEDALLAGDIDLAVHSFKDVPSTMPSGLVLAGNSGREEMQDVLLVRPDSMDEVQPFSLKQKAVVGTSSARRKAQIKFWRPDVETKDIRGNVPTRIRKMMEGQFDAIILAKAGMKRINADVGECLVVDFDPKKFVPAPAQGVLAFQVREGDEKLRQLLEQLSDQKAWETVEVERKLLAATGGGCHVPLGAYCETKEGQFHLWTIFSPAADAPLRRVYRVGTDRQKLVDEALKLLKKPLDYSVFITRDKEKSPLFTSILEAAGMTVEGQSLVDFKAAASGPQPDSDWLFFTSPTGVGFFKESGGNAEGKRVAALGEGTAAALLKAGVKVDFKGTSAASEEVARQFLNVVETGAKVMFPRGSTSNRTVQQVLEQEQKVAVTDWVIYQNTFKEGAVIEDSDFVVFTSSLNAEGYLRSKGAPAGKVIAIGAITAGYLHQQDITPHAIATMPDEVSLADAVLSVVES